MRNYKCRLISKSGGRTKNIFNKSTKKRKETLRKKNFDHKGLY